MSGRRRNARMTIGLDGELRVARDVSVRITEGELVAVSSIPAPIGSGMILETVVNGLAVRMPVRIENSRPLLVSGGVKHRLGLTCVHEFGPEQHQPARLITSTAVRIVNYSAGGCLLETRQIEPVDMIAALHAVDRDALVEDLVQVVRCEAIDASAIRYRVAVRFLPVAPLTNSLRAAMQRAHGDPTSRG